MDKAAIVRRARFEALVQAGISSGRNCRERGIEIGFLIQRCCAHPARFEGAKDSVTAFVENPGRTCHHKAGVPALTAPRHHGRKNAFIPGNCPLPEKVRLYFPGATLAVCGIVNGYAV